MGNIFDEDINDFFDFLGQYDSIRGNAPINELPDKIEDQIEAMRLNEYQNEAMKKATYNHPMTYPALGLAAEAGEVTKKVKNVIRDHNFNFADEAIKKDIALELGEVLWYVAALANDLGCTLENVARMNLKLDTLH